MTKVVNLKKEKYDVYIGRGSIFGNPYTHLTLGKTKAGVQVKDRNEAIEKYRAYFYDRLETDEEFLDAVLHLKDKILGCYCAPNACHGNVIAEFLDKL